MLQQRYIQKRTQLAELVNRTKSLAAELEKKGKEATADEQRQLAEWLTEAKTLRDEVEQWRDLQSLDEMVNAPAERRSRERFTDTGTRRKTWGRVKHFTGESRSEAEEKAYRFGMWYAGAVCNWDAGRKFCQENGIEIKTMKETVNTAGGALVPDEFDSALIDLREQYGAFRRNARVVPMMRDVKNIGRRTSGLTAYFMGEAGAPTEAEKTWDIVSLTARKLMTLTRVSAELDEDILISLADDLAYEIAYAFANKEDDCGFNGDASATYGGITGVRESLKGLDGTIANIAGLVVASGSGYGTSYDSIGLADFNKLVGKLPQYADGRAKWYCHRFFWAAVMQRLATAAGGVTSENIEGKHQQTFLGYPVEIVQVMPKVSATSQVVCLFGDLRLAARFGDRRQTTISMSEHRYFDTDEIGVKGTERFDIVVHDVGNASATANARIEGPIVGLITGAS